MAEITPQQFLDWRAYSLIEPFADVRSDYHAAMIVKALWDINRDVKKHPQPFPLESFVLQWTAFTPAGRGMAPAPTNTQTPEERTRNLSLWAMACAPGPLPEKVL